MDIIFLRQDGRQRLHLGAAVVRALGVGLALAITAAFLGGTKWGIASVRVPPTGAVSAWHQDLALQQSEVRDAIQRSEENLDVLSSRLGRLQAEAMRIDAIGRRVVAMAELDSEEFGFSEFPALGGPRPPDDGVRASFPDFLAELADLEQRLADRRPKLEVLESVLLNRELRNRTTPSGRPIERGWLSSGYGYRRDPLSGRRSFHHGVDFAAPRGATILAAAAGVVSASRRRPGYGKTVEITHADGYVTRYAHNHENLVEVGQVVRKGEPIALMGSTGRSTGSHVHYEVLHRGKPVDPRKFITKLASRAR